MYLVHATYVQQHHVLTSYVPTSRAMCYRFCSFAFESIFFLISRRICRKHVKFTVSWPSLVSYQCLHAYTAKYCPTPCSLRLCGSCTLAQLRYLLLGSINTARDLNAGCFFLQKKINTAFFFFCSKQNFQSYGQAFFKKRGFFDRVPSFLLSRLSVKALP